MNKLTGYKQILRTREHHERIEFIKSVFHKFGVISWFSLLGIAIYATPGVREFIVEKSTSTASSVSQRIESLFEEKEETTPTCEREGVKSIVEGIKSVPAQQSVTFKDNLCAEQLREYSAMFYPDGQKAVESMKKLQRKSENVKGITISHTAPPKDEPYEAPSFKVKILRSKNK